MEDAGARGLLAERGTPRCVEPEGEGADGLGVGHGGHCSGGAGTGGSPIAALRDGTSGTVHPGRHIRDGPRYTQPFERNQANIAAPRATITAQVIQKPWGSWTSGIRWKFIP